MKKLFQVLFFLASLAFTPTAKAQFSAAEVILIGKMLAQSILQTALQKSGNVNTAAISATDAKALELEVQNAQAIATGRYRGLQTLLWDLPYLLQPDVYGRGGMWMGAAAGTAPAAPAYLNATVPVPFGDNPKYYLSASPEQKQRIDDAYALLQITDGEDAASLKVIGDSNAAIVPSQLAINNLVADSFTEGFMSSNPQLSQIALAQKANISSGMNVQVEMQNQQILTHILHQLVIMNTRARNSEASALTADSLIHQQQVQASQSVQGLGAALNGFRF